MEKTKLTARLGVADGLKAAYHELLTAATPAGATDPSAVALAFVQTAFKEVRSSLVDSERHAFTYLCMVS